jgi:hypothetical protein
VFRDGLRYFLSADKITSINSVAELILRIDMPGHLKHNAGDSFERIYLSYESKLPASAFCEDFPPDAWYHYQRDDSEIPEHMIRAYQVRQEDRAGPWLAGITLDPGVVYDAWCHQRTSVSGRGKRQGYVCFIEEIGGRPVAAGESFGAAYAVGWFDSIEDMHTTADAHRGLTELSLDEMSEVDADHRN